MKERQKNTKIGISDYYKTLTSYKEKTSFRNEVMEKCDIAYPTFDVKMRLDTWSKLEREAVEKIIEERNEKGY